MARRQCKGIGWEGCVHQHKHLGVILSSTLSWSPHVEHLISRSSAMLGLLRHLLSYFHFSSRCLLKVYLCYIRPLLEYGCSSFVGLSVRSARQLEAVQQKALSICSVDSDCIPSLSERRSSVSLRLFFSILDDNVPDHLSGFCHWPFVHTATSRTLRNSSAIRPRKVLSSLPRIGCLSLLPPSILLIYSGRMCDVRSYLLTSVLTACTLACE